MNSGDGPTPAQRVVLARLREEWDDVAREQRERDRAEEEDARRVAAEDMEGGAVNCPSAGRGPCESMPAPEPDGSWRCRRGCVIIPPTPRFLVGVS